MDPSEKNNPPRSPADKTPAPTLSTVLRSHWFALALKIFIALVAALLIFQLGMYVGFRKANYSFGWGDNYHRTFGGPKDGFMRGFEGKDFVSGHGTAGTIASISDDGIIIKGGDGVEKMVTLSPKTSIIKGRSVLKASDLRIDDTVTVIGQPQKDGKINAEIVRVFSTPAAPPSAPPTPPNNY
jgi:hypothetical protein